VIDEYKIWNSNTCNTNEVAPLLKYVSKMVQLYLVETIVIEYPTGPHVQSDCHRLAGAIQGFGNENDIPVVLSNPRSSDNILGLTSKSTLSIKQRRENKVRELYPACCGNKIIDEHIVDAICVAYSYLLSKE
jgi:hypothetical protein